MKLLKKVSLAVMSLCLVLLLTVTNTQAQTYTVKQGTSENLTFTYSNMVSLQGDIVVEDTNKIRILSPSLPTKTKRRMKEIFPIKDREKPLVHQMLRGAKTSFSNLSTSSNQSSFKP